MYCYNVSTVVPAHTVSTISGQGFMLAGIIKMTGCEISLLVLNQRVYWVASHFIGFIDIARPVLLSSVKPKGNNCALFK